MILDKHLAVVVELYKDVLARYFRIVLKLSKAGGSSDVNEPPALENLRTILKYLASTSS